MQEHGKSFSVLFVQKNRKNRKKKRVFGKPDETGTTFDNYFTNIGAKLANKTDPVPGSYLDHIKASVDKTMYTIPTTPDEILKICTILKSSKSAAFGNFTPKAIKPSYVILFYHCVISLINPYLWVF